jgi:hypothetical protein
MKTLQLESIANEFPISAEMKDLDEEFWEKVHQILD